VQNGKKVVCHLILKSTWLQPHLTVAI